MRRHPDQGRIDAVEKNSPRKKKGKKVRRRGEGEGVEKESMFLLRVDDVG